MLLYLHYFETLGYSGETMYVITSWKISSSVHYNRHIQTYERNYPTVSFISPHQHQTGLSPNHYLSDDLLGLWQQCKKMGGTGSPNSLEQ